MSNIDLAEKNWRWRWRRSIGSKSIGQMLETLTGDMEGSGTFTNTLLRFDAVPFEFPPKLVEYFTNGIPDPAPGIWYRGVPEEDDKYADDWDVIPTVGTFWAKLWEPTPNDQGTL